MTDPNTSGDLQERFALFFAYLKLSAWLRFYPEMSLDNFELIWPTLLDSMLGTQTAETIAALAEQVVLNMN